jgi:hypothetical protein
VQFLDYAVDRVGLHVATLVPAVAVVLEWSEQRAIALAQSRQSRILYVAWRLVQAVEPHPAPANT